MFDRSLVLLLALTACASAPSTPPPTPDATAASEAPVVAQEPTPGEAPPQAPTPASEPAMGGPPPPPPPQALAPTDAFFIIGLPGTSSTPAARVCDSDATCKPLTPGENGKVVRRFGEESWVVVSAPGARDVAVVSDGKTATVTLTPRCPGAVGELGTDPRIVLYRVARSVTAAKVSTAPAPACSK